MAFRFVPLGCALLLCGCSDEDGGAAGGGAPRGCAHGEWQRDDGACVPLGLPPDMPCPPGEWLREAECIPAGVPPDGCGEGFVHDIDRGCEPILPVEDCPEGLMAVPGETSCREVAPCASGPFGDVPVEPNTEYVDASYMGGASDGSQAAPWTTIQAGIDAALPGAIVAVAAGSYLEDLVVQGKPVRLWGKCPALVELRGTGSALTALFIRGGANGTEVRRLAVTGPGVGLVLSGSEDVLVDELWVHDNASRGVDAENVFGPTSLVVTRSLLEKNYQHGMFAGAVAASVEATVVRDTFAQGDLGHGIEAQNDATGTRASLTVMRSLIERNNHAGLSVWGSDTLVEASVVRGTTAAVQDACGCGIVARDDTATGAHANLTVARSMLERNREVELLVEGSNAMLEATVVRDTLPDPGDLFGAGIKVEQTPGTQVRATVTLLRSLLARAQDIGVSVTGSDATVEASVVRDTSPSIQGIGRGISAFVDVETGARASLTVLRSIVERNHESGVLVAGADAMLEASVVRDTFPNAKGDFGHALHLQRTQGTETAASARCHASLFERSVEAAVAVIDPATAELEACLVRDTAANENGFLGDGLVVLSYAGPGTAAVTATRIEESERAAVSNFGATVVLESSFLLCQDFDIGAETWQGKAPFFDNRGGVLCGCPEATEPCKAESYALEPPTTLE